jgi:hypothetical protein
VSDFSLTITADTSKAIAGFAAIPGAAATAAQRTAIVMSGAYAKAGKSADEAVKSVQDYAKALVAAGASEKAAAAEALAYAKSMSAALDTQKVAATEVGTGYNRANAGAANLFHQLKDMATGLASGQNPMQILTQQGPQVFDAFALGGGAAATMGAAVAGVTALVTAAAVPLAGLVAVTGLLTAAYRVNSLEADRVIERRTFEKDLADSLKTSEEKLTDAYIAEAVAEGAVTKEMGKEITYRLDAQRAVEAYAKAQQVKIDGLNADIESSKNWIMVQHDVAAATALVGMAASLYSGDTLKRLYSGEQLSDIFASNARAINETIDSFTGLQSGTAAAKSKIDDLNGAVRTEADLVSKTKDANINAAKANEKTAEAKKGEKEARKENTKALEAERLALKRWNDAMAAENKAAEDDAKSWAAATNALDKMSQGFRKSGQEAQRAMLLQNADPVTDTILKQQWALADLDTQRALDVAAIEAQHKAQMALAGDSATGKETADQNAKAAALAAEQSYQDQKAAIILQSSADIQTAQADAAAKAAEAETAARSKDLQNAQQFVSGLANLFGGLSDIAGMVADSVDPKANQAAYMEAFNAAKAFSIAQATLNTAMAVSQALATPAPPPIPEIAAVVAGIAGGVQIAKIASAQPPKFHKGTLAADEFHAILQNKEAVIPADVMARPGAKEQAAALVSGRSPVTADEVSKGMDGSSVPGLLRQLSDRMDYVTQAVNDLGTATLGQGFQRDVQKQMGRPGHKGAYAYGS